jgi:hypothetical protein
VTSLVDIANQGLSLIGTRSSIADLAEGSNESIEVTKWVDTCRRQVLRMAPWNSAKNFDTLALLSAAPGTPENPSAGSSQWQKGLPPPPWSYEYAYPADALRPIFIVPQFTTGFGPGVPITTAITGGAPQFWNGPPVKFAVGVDQIVNGVPQAGGQDAKVIWTNQEFAVLAYLKDLQNPDIMDDLLQMAWASYLASKLAIGLTGDKGLANLRIKDANEAIQLARAADGNEGLTINDVTPDWLRTRGIDFAWDWAWSPGWGAFDYGGLLPSY